LKWLQKIKLTTIQRMFILLGALMLAIYIVFFAVFSYIYRQNIRHIAVTEMESNLSRIDEYIGLMVRNTDNVSSILMNNEFLQRYLIGNTAMVSTMEFRNFDTLLKNITHSTDFITSIDIYISPHKMLFTSDLGATSRLSEETIDFLDETIASDDVFRISSDYRERVGPFLMRGKNSLTILRPLFSMYTGEKNGLVAINIDVRNFQRILQTIQSSRNIIVDRDGRLMVDSLDGARDNGPVVDNRLVVDIKAGENVMFRRVGNQEYAFLMTEIDIADWLLVSYTSTDMLIQKGMDLQSYLLVLILVLVLFVALTVVMVMRQFSKRVYTLVSMMERVKGGDFDVVIKDGSRDEFSYLFTSFQSMVQHIDALFNEIYCLELMHKDAQLKLLQTQINPHFIYNIFNNMSWLIQMKRIDELDELVDAVGLYYRLSLNDGKLLISVSSVLEKLHSYILIQQIRFRDRIKCEFDVDEDLQEEEILNHLLQPLLENAITHGIEPVSGKHTIKVIGRREVDDMVFTVSDDGRGIPPERLEKIKESFKAEQMQGEFFALCNTNSRIKIYYGSKYGITLKSTFGSGTTVVLRIPGKSQKGKRLPAKGVSDVPVDDCR